MTYTPRGTIRYRDSGAGEPQTFVSIDQPDRLAEEIAAFFRATKPAAVAA